MANKKTDNKSADTIRKQLDEAKKIGITIKNEKTAEKFLRDVNYYRVLPYMRAVLNDNESDDVSFERVVRIYKFDNRFRQIIYKAIQNIELFLRTRISYYYTSKYGEFGYLSRINFSSQHDSSKFKARLKNCIEVNHNNPLIKAYGDTDKYPLALMIEFFSMNMLATFYSDLITENKKKLAAEMYGATANQLVSWLCCITDLRNKCAHFSRLYNANFTSMPVVPRETKFVANRKLFTQLLVLSYLYNGKQEWNNDILCDIENLIDEYSDDINLKQIGFPEKWKNLLQKKF